MQRSISVQLVFAALCALPLTALAEDYPGRHDKRLERMIMDRVAERIGQTRGALEGEWRPPTVIDRLAGLSSVDMSVVLRRRDSEAFEVRTPARPTRTPPPMIRITDSSGTHSMSAGER